MEKYTLNAQVREKAGKGAARSLRREGRVPAVIYRAGESTPLTMDHKELVKFINVTAREQATVDMRFPEGTSRLALLKDYQLDPVKGELLHADFMEMAMDEAVTISIPVITVGEAVGVKRDKGILQHELREVEAECLPGDIPGHIEIDIRGLSAGHSLHVSDLAVPPGVTILTDPAAMVVTVAMPALVEEAAPAEEAAEGPELIKKVKPEAEEG
ncbi:MAG: 50S ribosomal protein L25 [Nitrospirota bacterium]|jgi:large subunit ribosomal protein L25